METVLKILFGQGRQIIKMDGSRWKRRKKRQARKYRNIRVDEGMKRTCGGRV